MSKIFLAGLRYPPHRNPTSLLVYFPSNLFTLATSNYSTHKKRDGGFKRTPPIASSRSGPLASDNKPLPINAQVKVLKVHVHDPHELALRCFHSFGFFWQFYIPKLFESQTVPGNQRSAYFGWHN